MNNGVTIAHFHSFGKVDELIHELKSFVSGSARRVAQFFRIVTGIPETPGDPELERPPIILMTSSLVVWLNQNESGATLITLLLLNSPKK